MSFALSGTTITQSGTDTDLSGLSGIAGVTSNGANQRFQYVIDGLKLIIDGTLNLDPLKESIHFINTDTVELKISGVLNVNGNVLSRDGVNTYIYTSTFLSTDRTSTSTSNSPWIEVTTTGQWNWRGGDVSGEPTIYIRGGVLFNKARSISENDNMLRLYSSNLVFEGPFVNVGKRTTISTSGIVLDNYSPINGSGMDQGGSGTSITLNNFQPFQNIRDGSLRFQNANTINNSSAGMKTKIGAFTSGNNSANGGAYRLYRNVNFTVLDVIENLIQDAKVFIKSHNDGNRIDLTPNFGAGWNFSNLNDVILTTDVNGKTVDHNYILKVWYLITTTGTDMAEIRFDKNADDTGIVDISSISYNNNPTSYTINLTGIDTYEDVRTLLPDTQVTERDKGTVAAYTTLETSQKFYDYAKAFLVDNYAGETATIVTRVGDTIDAGSYDVVLASGGSNAFDFDGTTITARVGTSFDGSITTTGVVTLSGSASVTGFISDANGDSQASIVLPTGYDTVSLHATAQDADDGTNAIFTGSPVRYQSATYGGQTVYLRITKSTDTGTELFASQVIPAAAGEHTFSALAFSESAQLTSILGQLSEMKVTNEAIAPALAAINNGVKKASLLIPHSEELP